MICLELFMKDFSPKSRDESSNDTMSKMDINNVSDTPEVSLYGVPSICSKQD